MKSEEALEIVSGYAGRLNRRGSRATALRIVLAMAKAAPSLAWALEKHLPPSPDFSTRAGEAVTTRAREALTAFRKASGGDAP